jgi:hypothetical protein
MATSFGHLPRMVSDEEGSWMQKAIPTWLFVVVVVVVVIVAAAILWWRTGVQRTVITPEIEQQWKEKFQRGYRMPQPSTSQGTGPYRPPGAPTAPGR